MSPNLTITNSVKPYPGQLLGKSIFETGDVVSHDRQTSSKVAQTPRAPQKACVDSFGDVLKRITPRQREVLGFLAEGLEEKEIGVRLGISGRTVGQHILYMKWRLFGNRKIGFHRLTIFACCVSQANLDRAFRTARELVNA